MAKASALPYQPLAAPLPAKPGGNKVTDDWLVTLSMDAVDTSTMEWLDNAHLIYALPAANDKKTTKIELLDVQSSEHRVLTEGKTPIPSPDGQWIAFSKGEGKGQQLWLMKSDGTDITRLTHEPSGLGVYGYNFEIAWSPDSQRIALSHSVGPFQSAIDIIDAASLRAQRIISTAHSQIRAIEWFPDGQELLFWQEKIEGQAGLHKDQERIQSRRFSNGDIRKIAEFNGRQQFLAPQISPDGKQLVITYDPDHPRFDTTQNIGLLDLQAMSNHALLPVKQLTYDAKFVSSQWSRDGQNIYALRAYGPYKQIYQINAQTGKLKQITNAPFSVGANSYALSPDGSQLGWVALNAHGDRVIRVASMGGENVHDLVTIPVVPDHMALSEVREIEWDPVDYPSRMRGLLILPLNYHEGTKYPLIVDIHGGGPSASLTLRGAVLVTTPLEWQMWAAKGYMVFVPDFRSSGAFGPLAETRDHLQAHDMLNKDIIDVEKGVDALIARGMVDANRLAVIGHSAGGLRVNWLTATRHQFRAVISKEGWADEYIIALNPPKNYPIKLMYYTYGGTPQEVPQNYLKNSSLFHASEASTPTLFLMANPKLGGVDISGTVPLFNGLLKAKGIETQYIYYPDEGHVFEKTANRLDALKRSEKWMDDHVST